MVASTKILLNSFKPYSSHHLKLFVMRPLAVKYTTALNKQQSQRSCTSPSEHVSILVIVSIAWFYHTADRVYVLVCRVDAIGCIQLVLFASPAVTCTHHTFGVAITQSV